MDRYLTKEGETVAEAAVPDPFADFDYNGQNFWVYTSTNDAANTLVSSNFLIQGPEELTGEATADAAFERNAIVSELLNVNLQFTQVNLGYADVQKDVRTYIMAGEDLYDVVINDLYGLTGLSRKRIFPLSVRYWKCCPGNRTRVYCRCTMKTP